jgi:MFS family permease
MPIVIPFFESNQYNFEDVMQLQALHALSMVLFEIPSGYFSDKLGRKNTMIFGCILG